MTSPNTFLTNTLKRWPLHGPSLTRSVGPHSLDFERTESTLSCLNRLFPVCPALVALYHMMKYMLHSCLSYLWSNQSQLFMIKNDQRSVWNVLAPEKKKCRRLVSLTWRRLLLGKWSSMTSKCSPSQQGSAFGFSNRPSLLCLYLKAICLPYLYLKAVAEYHFLNGSIFTSHLA